MIDRANPGDEGSPTDEEQKATAERRELFLDLFDQRATDGSAEASRNRPAADVSHGVHVPIVDPPSSPHNLRTCGLTLMQVCELVTKELYLHGTLLGVDIARHVRLPFPIVDEALRFLKQHKAVEVTSGDVIGTASYQFNLTQLGTRRAKEAFERCGYVGPAPVSLEQYVTQCRRQAVSQIDCSPDSLRRAMHDMIIRDGLVEELGPAICSGKSIFIYGPPGNGKTILAKAMGRFLNEYGGEIYVPYAVQTENSVITLLDPTLHQTTDDTEIAALERGEPTRDEFMAEAVDLRWRRVRRPVVITGGELNLDMLDLRLNKNSNFYNAPLHIKANGGVFLIDDFGRQLVSPRDLLNRWILPLEEHADYLTLSTGKKIEVPFEQLIIFSTNIDPEELVDEAFLRRIRHKIRIDAPSRETYTAIFRMTCERKGVEYREEAIRFLYETFYDQGKAPRSSDPRDLIEIVQSICRFTGDPLQATPELLSQATDKFFCSVEI